MCDNSHSISFLGRKYEDFFLICKIIMIKIQGFKNLTQLAVFDLQASQYLNVAISHG